MATAGLIALGAVILLFGLARLFSGSQARSPEGSGDRLQGVLSPSSMGLLMDLKARVAEARRLGEARDRTAVPILAQFSRDSDVQFRKACIRALGEIGDQEGVNALRARMWDDEAEVREETARAFAKLYGETAYKGLSDMVDDKDTRVRLAVAEAFATAVEDKQAIGQLEKMLSDPAREVRFAALRGLCKSPADEASAALIKALKDAEGDIRVAAATEIAGRRGGAACQALGWALGSADAAVRAVAAEAIRKIGKPAVPHLKAALTATPSVQARTAAVRLLGEAGGADAAPLLVGMLDGMGQRPDPKEVAELRSAIVDGLSAIGTDAVPTLRDEVMAGERSAFAEEAAAEVCVRIGAPAVPPIVANILKWKVYPDPRELELWIRTLGRIGDPAARPAHRRDGSPGG
jgi:HEAT repeat protein